MELSNLALSKLSGRASRSVKSLLESEWGHWPPESLNWART